MAVAVRLVTADARAAKAVASVRQAAGEQAVRLDESLKAVLLAAAWPLGASAPVAPVACARQGAPRRDAPLALRQ
jgi:hypothetical protein